MKDFKDSDYEKILERFKSWIVSVSYAMQKKRHNPDMDRYKGNEER